MKVEKQYSGPCPCGSRRAYAKCCQRWHDGEAAADAESLMRSRYTAYVLGLEDYLLATWHPRTRPAEPGFAARSPRWLGLKVLRHEAATPDTAIVEFTARYKAGGRAHEMHEVSRFVRENGRWLYMDGDTGGAA
jgi:SEC-C motif-containing protein